MKARSSFDRGGATMLGKHLMSTVWLYVRDPEKSKAFYRDALGLRPFDEHSGTVHFDAGNIRLSLHPWGKTRPKPAAGSFLVFYVEHGIDRVYCELRRRGVRFREPLREAPFGRVAGFVDPDGHEISIWQPPQKGSRRYRSVEPLVRQYERLAARLRP